MMPRSKGNVYRLLPDQRTMEVHAPNGATFYVDAEDIPLVQARTWYVTVSKTGIQSVISSRGHYLHRMLMGEPVDLEVDHIDLNRLNNRKDNLRICTHQQNQCNQPLQANNTSGVSGVSYYPPRKKYRARIKASQLDIHLGYFSSLEEAVQARNEGIKLMFGEYARINDVSEPPGWIKQQVYEKCSRFRDKAAVSF